MIRTLFFFVLTLAFLAAWAALAGRALDIEGAAQQRAVDLRTGVR